MKLLRQCALAVLLLCSAKQPLGQSSQEIGLRGPDKLEVHNVKAESVRYFGRAAVRISDVGTANLDDVGSGSFRAARIVAENRMAYFRCSSIGELQDLRLRYRQRKVGRRVYCAALQCDRIPASTVFAHFGAPSVSW
jgi:hypothetical protein